MDLKLHIDFCFSAPGGLVIAAGWSPHPRPELVIHAGAASVPPARMMRFPRRDLRSLEPLGYLALFDLSDHPDALDDPSEDVFLALGTEYSRIDGGRLASDGRSLVEIGVDESFYALLRLFASGAAPLPDANLSRRIIGRIQAASALPHEAETHAMGVDRALLAPGGQGVASGWFLPTAATQGDLTALAFDDSQLARVTLAQAATLRTDLEAYSARYAYSGRDGWLAAFRMQTPVSGSARMLVMIPGQMTGSGVLHSLTRSPARGVARALTEARLAMADLGRADALHRATLRPLADGFDTAPPAPETPDAGAPLLLVLDHDLGAPDLRDVLGRVSRATGRAIDLHLLAEALTPDLRDATDGAAREAALPIRLSGCAPQPPEAPAGPALMLFGRSSVLFHLAGRLPGADDAVTGATVLALDPLAGLPGGAGGDMAARFAHDRPPFAAWGDAGWLLAQLGPLLTDTLVPESALRLLASRLAAQGQALIAPADATGFHAGRLGPFAAPLIDALTPHDFDAISARLNDRPTEGTAA